MKKFEAEAVHRFYWNGRLWSVMSRPDRVYLGVNRLLISMSDVDQCRSASAAESVRIKE